MHHRKLLADSETFFIDKKAEQNRGKGKFFIIAHKVLFLFLGFGIDWGLKIVTEILCCYFVSA